MMYYQILTEDIVCIIHELSIQLLQNIIIGMYRIKKIKTNIR